jgi:hypothetical protein
MRNDEDKPTALYPESLVISTEVLERLTAADLHEIFEVLVKHGFEPKIRAPGEAVAFDGREHDGEFTAAEDAITRIVDGENIEVNVQHGRLGFEGRLQLDPTALGLSINCNGVRLTDAEKCDMATVLVDTGLDLLRSDDRPRLFSIFSPPAPFVRRQMDGQYDIWSMITWFTILGPEQVDALGRDRLLTAPAHRVEELDTGTVLIVLIDNIDDFDGQEETYQAVTEHLDRPPE